MQEANELIANIKACRLCEESLPMGPRPVLQWHPKAKLLIVGQAPGRRVHETGVPFNDPSGDRLRLWLGLEKAQFYNPELVALLPMAFCYPGTGKSGDLPPPPECAKQWRQQLLAGLAEVELTLVLGQYALKYHFPESKVSLTEMVKNWTEFWPQIVPMPHPSPRNNLWLKRNPWFEQELIPKLQTQVASILSN